MKFLIQREVILKPLQMVSGVVEKRQTLPILSNVLLTIQNGNLSIAATDLEVELIAEALVDSSEPCQLTFSARKFMDICRALPEGAMLEVTESNHKVLIRSGKSRFTLSTLAITDFPKAQEVTQGVRFAIPQQRLKKIIASTYFAMAQQDVRYYLNGLLIEVNEKRLRAVATDGHRLALCDSEETIKTSQTRQFIIPRKGVLELLRLLEDSDSVAEVSFGETHVCIKTPQVTLTSKLIDGKFPDYERVIPQGANKRVVVECEKVKQALSRASILSNEKYRGIRLSLASDALTAVANNPELEEAEETVDVEYKGDGLEIGFNVNYMIDALAGINAPKAEMLFNDANSSCLIQPVGSDKHRYVIMPMRL